MTSRVCECYKVSHPVVAYMRSNQEPKLYLSLKSRIYPTWFLNRTLYFTQSVISYVSYVRAPKTVLRLGALSLSSITDSFSSVSQDFSFSEWNLLLNFRRLYKVLIKPRRGFILHVGIAKVWCAPAGNEW